MRDSRANHHRTEAGDGAERKQKESRRRERCEKRAKGFARWRPGERKKDKKERKGFGTERRFKSEPGGRQKKKKTKASEKGENNGRPDIDLKLPLRDGQTSAVARDTREGEREAGVPVGVHQGSGGEGDRTTLSARTDGPAGLGLALQK